ncbi:unnamed protein product [Caenorhabditis brenneri]
MVFSKSLFVLLFLTTPAFVSGQCEEGSIYNSHRNLCFTFYNATVDFNSAETICATSNGHLASVHNIIDSNYLAQQAQNFISTNGVVWIGAKASSHNLTDPNSWSWTDGTPFDFQNYQSGQPLSMEMTACMQLSTSNSKWKTASCFISAPFICQNTPPCPPRKINSCPSEYYYLEETQSCYKTTIFGGDYSNAYATCQNDGGDLASVHSETENQFLVDISTSGMLTTNEEHDYNIYIGLIYTDKKWQWTDGTSFNYAKWAPGEPNNMNFEFWNSITFLFITTITAVFSDITADYCRVNKTRECAAVDIWFGRFDEPRLFPLKCLNTSCPEGTICEKNESCWQEVMVEKKFKEVKLENGVWKAVE